MRLVVSLVPDFQYSTKVREFPVDVSVHTDVPIEATRVLVDAALLTKVDDPNIFFGYVKHVLPGRNSTVVLRPEVPWSVRLNVFEHDDDFADLLPGDYCCEVRVSVGAKVEDKPSVIELRETISVALTVS